MYVYWAIVWSRYGSVSPYKCGSVRIGAHVKDAEEFKHIKKKCREYVSTILLFNFFKHELVLKLISREERDWKNNYSNVNIQAFRLSTVHVYFHLQRPKVSLK